MPNSIVWASNGPIACILMAQTVFSGLSTRADSYDFEEYENTIYDLQCCGYQVIIAPSRAFIALFKRTWALPSVWSI